MKSKFIRYFLIILFLSVSTVGFPEVVNWVVAKVGVYTITDYDVEMMYEFQQIMGDYTSTKDDAFEKLITYYSLKAYADNTDDDYIELNDEEIAQYITSLTNMTNEQDATTEAWLELYQTYPEQYELQLEAENLIQQLLFYDEDLKDKANAELPEEEMREYFSNNIEMFQDVPVVDFIVLAVEQPNFTSLSSMSDFESALETIKSRLAWSDDADYILDTYSWIDWESYSGRTGELDYFDLIESDYPEEVMSIPFMDYVPIDFVTGEETRVSEGAVIAINQAFPLASTGEYTFLIMKIVSLDLGGAMEYEDAEEYVDMMLKSEQSDEVVVEFLAELVEDDEIKIDIIDEDIQGVYDEYLGR